ncbi:hypothetical protein EVG20_g6974 [Dentipellis fragilis]|uniref:G-alpha-domain-containing protein n=1 Tax=Dentipellis fragilis TaxID=205917 RepID=A0A4Y9YHQ2_9AGAM|nr:hypothetical protein EVG20_g6974 [Dentipellis fragilis]
MGRSFDAEDPLSAAIAPPPDETPEQRAAREQAEEEARRVSDEIDEFLRSERNAQRKRKPVVKVLLLGQSESGKSTTLKNFQMQYAREDWLRERSAWRAVVHLNLLRSINSILDMLSLALRAHPSSPGASPSMLSTPLEPSDTATVKGKERERSLPPLELTEHHKLLTLRLAPLRNVQRDLENRIGTATTEPAPPESGEALPGLAGARRPQEFFVRSKDGWKEALDRLRSSVSAEKDGARRERERDEAQLGRAGEVIESCREDMTAVWADPVVREMLRRKGVRMEEAAGFFLDDIDRIARKVYEPSDDDVVRARLRTLGVQEYRFSIEQGHDWLMYDVGGTRSSRPIWYPYFDDVNAIIFLAPISAFDERLSEDPRVNRLEDSYALWRTLCGLKLLQSTQIVLFLNKCDLLERKLNAGVHVKDHVPSYGDRPNDVDAVKKYFQSHFKEIARQNSPTSRRFFVHLTSVVDTKNTAVTLRTVEEGILRESLRKADLL